MPETTLSATLQAPADLFHGLLGALPAQDPQVDPGATTAQGSAAGTAQDAVSALVNLDSVEWIDWTAMVLLGVFFLLGLFKGFWWQFSRIATLLAAWFLAGRFGPDGQAVVSEWFDPSSSPSELPLFLSYVFIFVLTVVVLSVIAMLLHKLIKDSGLSVYDRLGGAILGLGTGAVGVIVLLAGIKMFVPESMSLVQAADRSRTMSYSRQTLAFPLVKKAVPQPMLVLFEIEPPRPGAPGDGQPGAGDRDQLRERK